MAVRRVLQLGDPLLWRTCAPVADPAAEDVAELVADLRDTLAHWRRETGYGRGIAAAQIGDLRRVIYIDLRPAEGAGSRHGALINPTIVERSDETVELWDGCLSYLSVFVKVRRHARVRVEFVDEGGAPRLVDAESGLSELLQHEIDHLDGVLTFDRMLSPRQVCTREEYERRHR